ncbi:MAG: restriction endonuclease [Firmicutes bacterium]|nr:restriction endonuclease [Bacillota bacterium]
MEGHEFEAWLAQRFEEEGFDVEHVGLKRGGDQGADLILSVRGLRIAVQAKRSRTPVGNQAVREVFMAQSYYEADQA